MGLGAHVGQYKYIGNDGQMYATDDYNAYLQGYQTTPEGKAKADAEAKAKADQEEQQREDAYTLSRNQELLLLQGAPGRAGTILTPTQGLQKTAGFNPTSIL